MEKLGDMIANGTQSRQPRTSQDSTPRETSILADEATRRGYKMDKPAPEPEHCKFCGKTLQYRGFLLPAISKTRVFGWDSQPERCDCPRAKAYWERAEAKNKAAEEAKAAAEAAAAFNRRINRLLGDSGMGARFQNRTFDRFQVTPENQKAYTACKEYAAAFKAQMLPSKGKDGEAVPPQQERNGLFLVGGYGTGKTHLAAAVANELIRNGTPALCMTTIDLLANVRRTYNGQGDEADILKLYTETPLLIIDDLGSEAATEWTSSMIFTIVNARYEAYMPVIVTTNCGTEELTRSMTPAGCSERNAQKMIDRLREMCLAVPLDGPSWRAK